MKPLHVVALAGASLALFSSAASAQGNLAPARTNYSKCLGKLMRADLKANVKLDEFQAKLGGACKAEEDAFRTASVSVDVAAKIARATAEQYANEEISSIRENTAETFRGYMETNTRPE